jgi:undecaprenyl-diphosphatase
MRGTFALCRERRAVHLSALLVAGLVFAGLGSIRPTVSIDEPLLELVQQVLPRDYVDIAWFFNVFLRHTGIPLLWVATIGWFLWKRRNDYALLFVLLTAITPLTTALKQAIDRPRPAGDFTILQFPTDPSFPSGHTMTALAFFGLWFIVAGDVLPKVLQLPVRIACVAAVVLTGISRIYVGAHWPTDVMGALAWGTLFLVLLTMTHPHLTRFNPAPKTVL